MVRTIPLGPFSPLRGAKVRLIGVELPLGGPSALSRARANCNDVGHSDNLLVAMCRRGIVCLQAHEQGDPNNLFRKRVSQIS